MKTYQPTPQRLEFVSQKQDMIIASLKRINRPGTDNVIQHLTDGGFFTAPASVSYHNNFYGGLAFHSLSVMMRAVLSSSDLSLTDSIIICSLLHDVCKMDEYTIGSDGLPHHTSAYYANKSHLHGSKSVALLEQWGLQLTDMEKEAILYHMGDYTKDAPLPYRSVAAHPLVKCIHEADADSAKPEPYFLWDPNRWLCEFETAKTKRDTHAPRIKVWESTLQYVQREFCISESGKTVSLDLNEHIADETRFYQTEIPAIQAHETFHTSIRVINGDCLAVAKQMLESNPTDDVCVLNMASYSNPGGGVTSGAGAQEEYLFRCSDLYRSLYQYKDYCSQYDIPRAKQSYPLHKDWGGIYSPKVTILRGSEADGYPVLEEPWHVNVVSAAMQRLPHPMRRIPDDFIPQTIHTIQTILRIAYTNGQRRLVLSAIGCGAFHNPPEHMAELFRQVLSGDEFSGAFREVVFAIIDDHNAHISNVAAFQRVLG